MDLPNLKLPDHQNELIEQVASANPHTVVVLESGTAVTMPWIDHVAGVVEAWYAGSAGHKALANVLTGAVNPSGKLPITFPRDENQLPHSTIPAPPAAPRGNPLGTPTAGPLSYTVHYSEGEKVGYKWFEAQHITPLFPFGFGLSYTTYQYAGLHVDSQNRTVQFTVTNTGHRSGTEIAEVYAQLPHGFEESEYKRLVGWKRVSLNPGESQTVSVPIDLRMLKIYSTANNTWNFAPGAYKIFVGGSSASTPLTAVLQVP